ncbi:hypothetical protein BC938DRAFT_482603 [Jimgerdemannia flammicorona]|uniref:Phosphoribosyltransferase-like protein n=1 Tax=Jimgerdemannia flammicorona TaxID=994334 RepID=A0A433QDN2_9FUNG|nr:hypothetical protein BC938DRAFT_482603 [Jimgerdemannia flammicorona]
MSNSNHKILIRISQTAPSRFPRSPMTEYETFDEFDDFDPVEVAWFGEYHPSQGGRNRLHYEPHTQAILRLKSQNLDLDDYFESPISAHVRMVVENYGRADIMIIPSHDPSTPNSKFKDLVEYCIARIPGAISRLDDFQRVEPSPKLSDPWNAQDRLPDTLIDTCEIYGYRNARTVIVFDDVITSGSSMVGADLLLREEGYSHVLCVALGRTAYY